MRLARLFDDEHLRSLVHAAETDAAERLARLTPTQRKVLEGMVAGHQNKVIANNLGLSVRTVENHRQAIMERVETRNLLALARLVVIAWD